MDLQKIGTFLKELRNGEGLTQEQLAEKLNVSRRTVSRWETGSNMPDLDLLIEMADFYHVDIRELLNGERDSEKMNKELEETVLKVAEYSNAEKQRSTKIVCIYFVLGIVALIVNAVMNMSEMGDTFWIGFLKGATFATALASMILGILYTTGAMMKIQAFKMRLLGRTKEMESLKHSINGPPERRAKQTNHHKNGPSKLVQVRPEQVQAQQDHL